VAAQRSTNPVPRSVHGVSYAVVAGDGTIGGSALSSLLAHGVDEVSGTTTADMVNWSLMLHHLALTIELLVKREHGSLFLAMEVTCAATSSSEIGIG